MKRCSEHVSYQLPNEETRVRNVLDNIENGNAGLNAAIAQVRTDDGKEGMLKNFEKAAAYVIPWCPVVKRKSAGNKRKGDAIVSAAVGENPNPNPRKKARVGRTGVELRYHKRDEYETLSIPQKDELAEWREGEVSKGNLKLKGYKGNKRKRNANISSASQEKLISAAVAKELKKGEDERAAHQKQMDEFKALIMSVMREGKGKNANPNANASSVEQPLQIPKFMNSILGKTGKKKASIGAATVEKVTDLMDGVNIESDDSMDKKPAAKKKGKKAALEKKKIAFEITDKIPKVAKKPEPDPFADTDDEDLNDIDE